MVAPFIRHGGARRVCNAIPRRESVQNLFTFRQAKVLGF
jgi:hypothetical protein